MRLDNNYRGFVGGEMSYLNIEKVKISFPIKIDNGLLLTFDLGGEIELKMVYLESEDIYLTTHCWNKDEGKWYKISFENSKRIKILEKIDINEYIKRNFW